VDRATSYATDFFFTITDSSQRVVVKGGVPVDLHGSEQIIVNNFSELSSGRRVRVAPAAKLAKE
jgi:hypothetical protein